MIGDNWYPKGSLQEPFLPQEISVGQQIFPSGVTPLLPPQEKIPEEFKRHEGTVWNTFASRWFYKGLKDPEFYPVDGIDSEKAFTHVRTILGSYEPKHEYKEAAVAYLLSIWFTKIVDDGVTTE
jgi:hypothetical protein